MIVEPWPDSASRRHGMRRAWFWLAIITMLHFALGTRGAGARHALHIALAALYLMPIVAAAKARGFRGGLSVAFAAGTLYLTHVALRDPAPAAALLDELAVVAGFLAVGGLTGLLVSEAERRREERDRVLLAARRSEARNALEALVEALGARDVVLLEHSRRVAELAELIGRRLGFDRDRREELHLAGLLHDVGKIGWRDDVLFSNGSLSQEQRREIEDHPRRAAELVRSVGGDDSLAEIVMAHHERADGGGYPRGLRGEEIPLAARIVRVADVFVALTESRIYREPDPAEVARERMRSMLPDELDPTAFAALESVLHEGWWTAAREPMRRATRGASSER